MEIIKVWNELLESHIDLINIFINKSKLTHKGYVESISNRTGIGFNVFIISSDHYYRENFHSDIIKAFLDPKENHKEGYNYLHLFIELLNKFSTNSIIKKNDFNNSIVARESNYIDILITDRDSKKAIIIENKINNAVDQQRQLPRYVSSIEKEYSIVAIVYLTLNSSKRPDKYDWSDNEIREIDPVLKLIPAYEIETSKPNLYDDWIVPSIMNSNNIDSSFLLRQYGKLIKFLNTNTMDTISLKKFYNSTKEGNNLETAISIRNMLNDLPEYLAIRIEDRYKEKCYPFKKVWRYQKRDTVFEAFEIDDLFFKIDIWCDIDGYIVEFWESSPEYNIYAEYKDKLEILSDFKMKNNEKNIITKHFNMYEEKILLEFIDKFLLELKRIKDHVTT